MSLTNTEEIYTAKIDIFSQNRHANSVSMANADYQINLPTFMGNKRYIRVFVENFNIAIKTLSPEEIICVRLTTQSQVNSYDTSSGGSSNILITCIKQGASDYGITATNNYNGINIGSLPIGNINIRITNAHNTDLVLVDNVNDYSLHLRIEAYD